MLNDRYNSIRDALRRFTRDTHEEGQSVVAWPLFDPSFRILRLEYDTDYVRLFGYDGQGRESMIVMPGSQLAIQMAADSGEEKGKTFGFIHPASNKDA